MSRRRRRSFRYENMWKQEPSYKPLVESVWANLGCPASLGQLPANLGGVSCSLTSWAQTSFGSVKQELHRTRAEHEKVRRSSLRLGPTAKERRLMKRISELLTREEIMMRQHSRIDWLTEGDRVGIN